MWAMAFSGLALEVVAGVGVGQVTGGKRDGEQVGILTRIID